MSSRIPNSGIAFFAALVFLSALNCQGTQPEGQQLFPVEKDRKFGFIERTGRVVITPQFDSANEFHEGLALVTANGRKLFIDSAGKTVITPQFDIVHNFSEGLAAVNIGETRIPNIGLIANPGKWGYIDKTGKLAIPLKFTHAEDFSEGLAAVTDGDRGGFIDHTGKILFEVPLDVTLGFHEGVVGVLLKGTITYFDRAGKKLLISTDFGPKSNSFSEGLLPVETKGKWGFVDKNGRLVIDPQFEDASDFSDGLAPVKIHSEETTWCPPDASGSRSGFTMKWGYIDKTGKLIIPAQFESAAPFSEGLAVIHNCEQAFFIDKTGKIVVSGNFRYASSFFGGLARVETMSKEGLLSGLIDRTGQFVWGPTK
jgi:hypothetical protein